MEDSLLQKIQRVKITDVVQALLFLLAVPVALVYRIVRKDMWLLCDNENEARDNGYFLFRYIKEKHPEQDVVYAINKKSPDYNRVRDLGEVIQYGSFRHWVYYLAATVNISSQKGGKPNAAVCYFLEVYGLLRNKRVFLQHGITKDDMEFLYYRHTKMRLFICAVEREYQYIKQRFGYPEGWVKKTGFCRFDYLTDESNDKKQILVMPTWRNWIGRKTVKTKQTEDVSVFSETEYYRAWNGFLSNKRLHELLKEQRIELLFYPHREMQQYLDEFSLDCENIKIVGWPEFDVQKLLRESNLLVTDYSSVAMDFAYMDKPLLYYQFDYEVYRQAHYPKGYFDYDADGFGKVCKEEDALITEIERSINNEFEQGEEYHKRGADFFDLRDSNNCERNYQAIREII